MLTLHGRDFTVGRARFADNVPDSDESTAKLYVKLLPGDFGAPILAELDTGAPWSVLDTGIADGLGILDDAGQLSTLHTRLGKISGYLKRISVTILADHGQGESLRLEATVFVSRDWPGGSFVGYNGLLERIRFAVDPAQDERWFYFGPTG